MRLNVLTAVSRPENLGFVAESLAKAAERAPAVEVVWRWRFDLARANIGGQALKNKMLAEIPYDDFETEWVWCLDDDTLAHEDILVTASCFQNYDAIIFSQQRTDGRVLSATQDNMIVGSCDIGQAFLRRSLIGGHQIPEDYNGDGMFLSAVLATDGANVMYHPAALSLHNAISGVNVSV